jgi:hypothetical protein
MTLLKYNPVFAYHFWFVLVGSNLDSWQLYLSIPIQILRFVIIRNFRKQPSLLCYQISLVTSFHFSPVQRPTVMRGTSLRLWRAYLNSIERIPTLPPSGPLKGTPLPHLCPTSSHFLSPPAVLKQLIELFHLQHQCISPHIWKREIQNSL